MFALSHEGSELIALVKPQFEAKRDETESGVVKSDSVRNRVLLEVQEALCSAGFQIVNNCESPLKGPKGNVEFLVYAVFSGE